ncbi:hypothetical protein TrVFT333_007886 [Trichoderma virens FT-333]|nr:hypothetical protein TrVFT333_007886 [Trichoderma virens FT-333]
MTDSSLSSSVSSAVSASVAARTNMATLVRKPWVRQRVATRIALVESPPSFTNELPHPIFCSSMANIDNHARCEEASMGFTGGVRLGEDALLAPRLNKSLAAASRLRPPMLSEPSQSRFSKVTDSLQLLVLVLVK